ncbi:GM21869 [Drosophila sechellia]|uniref:GM21869 n=1 Tax=Drosophila sechellia TaxID=7238 RepID=B4IP77_DROSE|nr:GM21869 [Drosophila sechellia]
MLEQNMFEQNMFDQNMFDPNMFELEHVRSEHVRTRTCLEQNKFKQNMLGTGTETNRSGPRPGLNRTWFGLNLIEPDPFVPELFGLNLVRAEIVRSKRSNEPVSNEHCSTDMFQNTCVM